MDQFREDVQDDQPPLTCSWDPVGRGVRAMDGGEGTHPPGPPAAAGSVPGMWSRPSDRFSCSTPSNPSWCWSLSPVVDSYPHRRTTDISDLISELSGAAGLPSQAVSGEGGDKERTTNSLPDPAHAGYHDHFDVGKPPPPMVSLP